MTSSTTLSGFARWAFANGLPQPLEMIALAEQATKSDAIDGAAPAKPKDLTPEERRQEMRREHAALVAAGVKAPTQTMAKRHGITASRIRALMKKSDDDANDNPWDLLPRKK